MQRLGTALMWVGGAAALHRQVDKERPARGAADG